MVLWELGAVTWCRLHCDGHLDLKLHREAFGDRTAPVGVGVITEGEKREFERILKARTSVMGYSNGGKVSRDNSDTLLQLQLVKRYRSSFYQS